MKHFIRYLYRTNQYRNILRHCDRNFLLVVSVSRVFGWFKYWSAIFNLIEIWTFVLTKVLQKLPKIIALQKSNVIFFKYNCCWCQFLANYYLYDSQKYRPNWASFGFSFDRFSETRFIQIPKRAKTDKKLLKYNRFKMLAKKSNRISF